MSSAHHIVILGGGAGGLELATRLGDRLGRHGRAAVTLVDRSPTHLWKPLLHEVAAGSLDRHANELDYLAQARWHHFTFAQGALEGLDRWKREVALAPVLDEAGAEVIPRRGIRYDTLVIAIGSESNSFNVPGVTEHAFLLDSPDQADRLHRRVVSACLRANYRAGDGHDGRLDVVIVGGGATGVELAAELHNTTRVLAGYGLQNIDPDRYVRLTLLNADARILAALPERISEATMDVLRSLGVDVRNSAHVVEVTPGAVRTKAGDTFPAAITVWAAGIRCAEVLRNLADLETNRLNQLLVTGTLQTTRDPDVFAIGDCAACPWPGHATPVPPRAQAAHQQASHLVRTMERRLRGEALSPFRYRDFGSLVSLGEYSTVGTLMGFVSGKSMRVEGWFARLMYISLYKMHLLALHGFVGVALDTLSRALKRSTEPQVKLH
ncbi:MAG TPA: NAD(P)/FAD-dependent oxidoreductase [Burkholderiales bacterium]|nr:NAD(P)/FAD-dependent oxidoreductase [Burkholderiales bacterium]